MTNVKISIFIIRTKKTLKIIIILTKIIHFLYADVGGFTYTHKINNQ